MFGFSKHRSTARQVNTGQWIQRVAATGQRAQKQDDAVENCQKSEALAEPLCRV